MTCSSALRARTCVRHSPIRCAPGALLIRCCEASQTILLTPTRLSVNTSHFVLHVLCVTWNYWGSKSPMHQPSSLRACATTGPASEIDSSARVLPYCWHQLRFFYIYQGSLRRQAV